MSGQVPPCFRGIPTDPGRMSRPDPGRMSRPGETGLATSVLRAEAPPRSPKLGPVVRKTIPNCGKPVCSRAQAGLHLESAHAAGPPVEWQTRPSDSTEFSRDSN